MEIILITGATRGIGSAIAKSFASPKTKLILTGTKKLPEYDLEHTDIPNFEYVQTDFSDSASLNDFISYVKNLDRLDVCINNAGINIIKPLENISIQEFEKINAINYKAPFCISKAAVSVMKKRNGGHIVSIASIWSTISKSGRSLYSGAKTGLVGMTRALAVELAPFNILVNCVSPGFTLTELTRTSLSNNEIVSISSQIPLGRMADPVEMANIVRFLCSRENTYLTGQNIIVDGGFSIV